MITRLKELKQTLKDGGAEALVLSPATLYDILDELENMCVTTNTIEAKPVNNNRPGFWLHARAVAPAGAYLMGSQAATGGGGTVYSDTWSSAIGATTNGSTLVAGAFDGVKYDGPRIVITDTESKLGGINNGNPDGVYAIRCNISIFRRSMTFNSGGTLTSISAEDKESVQIVMLDNNYLLP